jgi:hypothetical protein
MLTKHIPSTGVVVAIGTIFVGKSGAAEHSSSNNVASWKLLHNLLDLTSSLLYCTISSLR